MPLDRAVERFGDLCAVPLHHHAPTRLRGLVGAVDLEDHATHLCSAQFCPRAGLDDHVGAIGAVVDREDDGLAVNDNSEPAEMMIAEQAQALVRRELLENRCRYLGELLGRTDPLTGLGQGGDDGDHVSEPDRREGRHDRRLIGHHGDAHAALYRPDGDHQERTGAGGVHRGDVQQINDDSGNRLHGCRDPAPQVGRTMPIKDPVDVDHFSTGGLVGHRSEDVRRGHHLPFFEQDGRDAGRCFPAGLVLNDVGDIVDHPSSFSKVWRSRSGMATGSLGLIPR